MAALQHSNDKHAFLHQMLCANCTTRIYLDGRPPDVRIPEKWKKPDHVLLELGLNLPVPIPDLRLEEAGFFATLSFERRPFSCFVPWERVFAIVDKATGRGAFWTDDMPEELKKRAREKEEPVRASHLRLVK